TLKGVDLKFPGFGKADSKFSENEEEVIQEIRKRQLEKLESLKSERLNLKKNDQSGLFGDI
ncbi:MAG: hypothetical protein HUU45_12740, partial [Leptospiraceae bacterium]|nr:hypothetical protein [Leptospiraceae bacterium]